MTETKTTSLNGAASAAKTGVDLVVTEERMLEISLDVFVAIESKTAPYTTTRDFIATFVVGDDGRFLDLDEARAAVGRLNLRQVAETSERLMKALAEVAAPKA